MTTNDELIMIVSKSLKSLYDICMKIQNVGSTNTKKEILAANSDNEEFKSLMRFLYDPLIVTGISNSKINKIFNEPKPIFSKKSFLSKINPNLNIPVIRNLDDLMLYVSANNTGRYIDIKVCQKFIDTYCESYELKDFVSSIITKSLKLGIDSKLVRNVYGKDFIYIFEVQNARSYEDVKLDDDEWFCLSQKMNGNRATYKYGDMISRQGKKFINILHITQELDKLQSHFTEPMIFDGEIVRDNPEGLSESENFTLGTGILNSDASAEEKSCLRFVLFDLLPVSEFIEGESKLTYRHRLLQMTALKQHINADGLTNISVVPFLYEGKDQSQIQIWLDKMDAEGKEGCMLARDVTYKCKRHNGLLKVKKFYTMDLQVIGYERGTGKFKDTLGALIVDFNGNEVGVGSGFSDDVRHDIWENREDIIGKIIEVKYKEISLNHDTGERSLQFPVFIRFRDDKTDVSVD